MQAVGGERRNLALKDDGDEFSLLVEGKAGTNCQDLVQDTNEVKPYLLVHTCVFTRSNTMVHSISKIGCDARDCEGRTQLHVCSRSILYTLLRMQTTVVPSSTEMTPSPSMRPYLGHS